VHERTTRKSVTFLHPFSLAGVDGKLEAGTYLVETVEQLMGCRSSPLGAF
jgi:hypothetical protein